PQDPGLVRVHSCEPLQRPGYQPVEEKGLTQLRFRLYRDGAAAKAERLFIGIRGLSKVLRRADLVSLAGEKVTKGQGANEAEAVDSQPFLTNELPQAVASTMTAKSTLRARAEAPSPSFNAFKTR
ncbi:MAG: hypothetical protein JJU19_13600, partial [Pararhodobacter sp.]|nr:hypothetical protein [Pararhodobacter sp.]